MSYSIFKDQFYRAGDGLLSRHAPRKGSKTLPGYWVSGGSSINPDKMAFTEKCGWVAAKDLPQLTVAVLADYDRKSEYFSNFGEYFHGGGKEIISELCERFESRIPEFNSDTSYYYDWGANQEFTTAHMGHGECSAGVYDMIEVSMNSIKDCLKRGVTESEEENQQTSWNLVYASAGMLLVTRGIDPTTESEIFNDTATTEIYTILFVGSVRCV